MGPVDFVVGAARALELFDPAPTRWRWRAGAAAGGFIRTAECGGWPAGKAGSQPAR